MELEGSQRFRQRLALSCISGKPFHLKNVRVLDTQRPGLNQIEADLLRLVDELSDGMTIIVDKKTLTSMKFSPGLLLGCHEGKSFTCSNKDRGLTYLIEFLIMIGPFCKNGVDILLKGLTDHPMDPSVDTLKAGCERIISKIGVEVSIQVDKRAVLPDGGGRVHVRIAPLKKLDPIKLVYPGRVKAIKGTAWTTNVHSLFASRCAESCRRVFHPIIHHVEIHSDIVRGERCGKSQGYGISLVAETMKGFCYTADGFIDRTSAAGKNAGRSEELLEGAEELDVSEVLGEEVATRLLARILDNGVCDSTFQWIPIYFMALSDEWGVSKVAFGRLGSSCVSMMRAIDEFLGLKFVMEDFVKADIEEDIKPASDDEGELDIEELISSESEKLRTGTERDRVVISCVGLGIRNMARKTF